METLPVKTCTVCKELKSADLFSTDKKQKDGKHYACKVCCQLRSQKWRQANKEKHRQTNRAWEQSNPQKVKAFKSKRKALVRNASVHKITNAEILKLYSSPCFYCGLNGIMHIDHVVPISRGGNHSIGNLVAACQLCNLSKSSKTIMEWKLFLLKSSSQLNRQHWTPKGLRGPAEGD
jgi:5-methylcytosine-specific restriction endonuclease McrA